MIKKRTAQSVLPSDGKPKRKLKVKIVQAAESAAGLNIQTKVELIKKFQFLEGSLDCYASAYARVCNQSTCLWRNECLIAMPSGEQHA